MTSEVFHHIGRVYPKNDGVSKATGQEKYASDVVLPRMLHARILRSPHPHAKVKNIDTTEAEKMGAVCLTFEDVPKIIYCGRISSKPEQTLKDEVILTDKPLYVGDRIAAVAAETEEMAQRALQSIKVGYEVLELILDPIESMKFGKPKIKDFMMIKDRKIKVENNIAGSVEIGKGDVENGFKESEVIVESEYRTGRPYHGQLETKSVVCKPEPGGGITVWTTTQTIHNVRILLGQIFAIPLNKINVKKLSIGGSFGSSIHMNRIIPVCAALALKAGSPVKLVQSREEDMHDHCRYPSIIKYKLGAKRDGTLVAGKMDVVIDFGAYYVQALIISRIMAGAWENHYKIPNMKFEAKAVYTNKVPACAMQGAGAPQVTFAIECMMDELAEKLGMDPIELRRKNHVGLGDMFKITPTIDSEIKSCGLEEIYKRGAELIGWTRRLKLVRRTGKIVRGIGMAKADHRSGTGAPIPTGAIDYSSAMIKINEDGTVDIVTSIMDLGNGLHDALVKMVAEELGVPVENVSISPVDTRTTPYDVCTHATRGLFVGGNTIIKVSRQVRRKLLENASRVLGVPAEALDIRPDLEVGQGIVFAVGIKGKEVSVGEVAETARQNNWGTIAAVDSYTPMLCPPAYTAYFVEVEVNKETGEIRPVRVVIGCDSGTIINPELADGQFHGGLYRGMGYALTEHTDYEKTGELLGKGYLTDYKMLTALDLPSLKKTEIFFTKTYEPSGPFGAKGIGEPAINPVAAAVANAVYNATGIRLREIPILPEKLLATLKGAENARGKQ